MLQFQAMLVEIYHTWSSQVFPHLLTVYQLRVTLNFAESPETWVAGWDKPTSYSFPIQTHMNLS